MPGKTVIRGPSRAGRNPPRCSILSLAFKGVVFLASCLTAALKGFNFDSWEGLRGTLPRSRLNAHSRKAACRGLPPDTSNDGR